ncbi:RHS repeat-associated core domain-containing protein [Pseudomonas sp. O64]|uniref:RHS repeat-associated core domain-containing protein n=1 Tax=unclassified Pseudomonas TaxID=196821 RepID=UPI00387ABAA0
MAHNPMGKDPADYESEPIFNATTQKFNMVNTRTGLFEAYVKMPTPSGNQGNGPPLEMDLYYSPLTNNQAALGDGWEFSTTIYSEEYEKLTLNTGETLPLKKGKNLKQVAVIAEWGADGKLTVYRKGGRTEVLSKLGDSLFYLPESLTLDGYYFLYSTWIATAHVIDGKTYYQTKLQRVKDSLRTLIEIDYTLAEDNAQSALTPVTLTFWPDDATETLRYELTIEDYALKSVTLADDIKTSFTYLDHKTAGWLLNTFTHWDGLVEEVEYDDNGLTFPDNPTLSALPCVLGHHLQPNGGGEPVFHHYEYSRYTNLKAYITTKTGAGQKTIYTYDHKTNEILSELTSSTTDDITTYTNTDYTISAEPNAIKNERSTTYGQSSSKPRKIDIHNRFNKDAALIENKKLNTSTTYEYDDGEKFLSDRPYKETILLGEYLNIAINTKTYLYTDIPGMSEPKLAVLIETFDPLNIINPSITFQNFSYYTDNDFRKGKLMEVAYEDDIFRVPKRAFTYTLGGANNTELTTKTVDTEPTGTSRTSSSTQSVLSGRLIRQVDTDGNRTEYTYDAFGRLATLTVCAQSPTYKQTTRYAYPAPGQVKVTEPNGQVRLSQYDGQDRLVREYEYVEANTQRLLREVSYDLMGRELRSTQYDYTEDGTQVSDWSEINYDDWGEVSGRRYSDGRQDFNLYDPIAMTRSEWTGNANDKHRKVTTYNADETIQKIVWHGQNGVAFQTQTATYTFEKRLAQLETVGEFGVTTIRYTYDVFGRVLTESHVENDKGLLPLDLVYSYHYTYPPLLRTDEPATIRISFGPLGASTRLLGSRTFDGWDRVTSLSRGNSVETYLYNGGDPLPTSKTTADGIDLQYEYIKELGNKLGKVSGKGANQQKNFTYAHATQSLSTASEGEHFLQYDHDLNLRTTQQRVQTQPGEAKEVSCLYSLAGRVLSDTDVFEHSTQFEYNPKGQRTRSVNTHDTSCTYTDQGLLKEEVVKTLGSASTSIKVTYSYDAEQRETSRRFVPAANAASALEITTVYYGDGKFKQVQLKQGSAIKGSRSFTYSAGGRLKACTTTGVWRPKNPKGKLIDKQEFTYDGLGNVTRCVSTFAGASNTATYTYDSSTGVRLEKIANSHADYTKSATLTYDIAGRVTQDQNGKKYTYDWLGRLIKAGSTRYSYDPSDRLMTQGEGSQQRQVIYNELQVNGEYSLGDNDAYRHMEPGSTGCTAQRTRISGVDRTLYEWRDVNGTVWVTYDAQANTTKFHAYSPYGEHFFEDTQSLLGDNGELYDSTIGQYPLGCGYRFLNPETRQFNAPDTSSPFGIGGPHAYGYCTDNDPINFQDPTGHFSVSNRLRGIWGDSLPGPLSLGKDSQLISTIIFTAIGVLSAVMTGGATLLLSAGMVVFAAISAATAVVSVLIADISSDWSEGLAWASLVFGVFSSAAKLGMKLAKRAVMFARYLGNSARAVGKNIFQRAAVISQSQKTVLSIIGETRENMNPLRWAAAIEPYPFNSNAVIPAIAKFEPFDDFNTIAFAVTGVLTNTGVLGDSKNTDGFNSLIGNGTWLPNGSWKSLWNKPWRFPRLR